MQLGLQPGHSHYSRAWGCPTWGHWSRSLHCALFPAEKGLGVPGSILKKQITVALSLETAPSSPRTSSSRCMIISDTLQIHLHPVISIGFLSAKWDRKSAAWRCLQSSQCCSGASCSLPTWPQFLCQSLYHTSIFWLPEVPWLNSDLSFLCQLLRRPFQTGPCL